MGNTADSLSQLISFPLVQPEQMMGPQHPYLTPYAIGPYQAETYDSLRYHINRLQGILNATETDLQQTKGKLEEARAAAQRDRDLIRKMENRIAELEDTVSKQKSTISTQSKTISSTVKSQHRALSFSFTTPQHHWTNGQEATRVSRYQHVFNNPPPKFGLGDPVTPISTGNQATNITSSASSTAKSTTMSAIDRLNAFVPPIGPKAAAEEKAIPLSSLPRNPPEDPTTRFVLLVKAINVFLISKVLRMGVVIGFDSTADSEIGQMMSLLYPDAPTTVRALLYEAMRRQVNRIRNKPLFTNFYNKRKNEHATALFRLLSPLVQRNHPKIWTDFVAIIEEAHNLALTMFSGPYEFQLHFAEVGDLFDAHSMFNRDATLVRSGGVGDPQTLMRKCHRVKLGVTPTIWFRNNSVPMNEPMQIVNMGHVMLSPMAVNG
ncbi:hypothetical protein I7I51_06020 [Histoplasma capsulatum]|uniref:Uncharacterized protein n=1 Tax=Ajellomyces capsulatus TaxID=5037 RepID=A0A8A1MEX6_AJECA|nr:hypothetical protein I7I51_06020 [Histoplasma capsulatum]